MKLYRSELQDRVSELGITFQFLHLYCELQTMDGKPMQYPVDHWYVSASYRPKDSDEDKVFHDRFLTGMNSRVRNAMLSSERGGFYYKLTGTFYKNEVELIKAGLLLLPTCDAMPSKKEERLFNLGVDFISISLIDASGSNESFKDWARDFGYNEDSLKALQNYLKCQETRNKLMSFFGSSLLETLSKLEH